MKNDACLESSECPINSVANIWARFFLTFFYSSIVPGFFLLLFNGCSSNTEIGLNDTSLNDISLNNIPLVGPLLSSGSCKIEAYIHSGLGSDLSSPKNKGKVLRIGILPFSVPESFSRAYMGVMPLSRLFAREFHSECLKNLDAGIVELFDLNSWSGMAEEFFAGNYEALDKARYSGYDYVLVGYMDEIKGNTEVEVYAKLIDVHTRVTTWYAKASVPVRDTSLLERFHTGSRPRPSMVQMPAFTTVAKDTARCMVEDLAY